VAQIHRSISPNDRHIAFLRRLLSNAENAHDFTITSVLHAGEFSTVYRGFGGGSDLTFKLLKWAPLSKMTEEFRRIGNARKNVYDPSFVGIHRLIDADTAEDQHTIIVSDYVKGKKLSEFLTSLTVDEAATLLRRVAEALAALHEAGGDRIPENEWEWTLVLLTSRYLFYDEAAKRLYIPSFGVSRYLCHILGWERFAEWVDPDARVAVAPELNPPKPSRCATRKTDQYMLGQLGLELLERQPIKEILGRLPLVNLWMDPDQFGKGSWKRVHPQLWNLLRKMLAFKPSERWESMRFVANKLRSLEGESRAIAKSVYLVPHPKKGGGEFKLQNEEAFYKRFYEIFLIKSPESERKFDSPQAQHLKLMNAIIAVLNYHEGNKPTSLDEFVEAPFDRHPPPCPKISRCGVGLQGS
jgi:serine/threonine protein kinase